ncbi:MAG: Flp pilus assembly complex ATPase component TadA [Oscillospiraceae bacterium]|nr:Flp pilus assembly complex ATPase component TadA [Oscillospiraceae bacterium]
MKCAWESLINILPVWMRSDVDKFGRDYLQEIRLRINQYPEFVGCKETIKFSRMISAEDLSFCINVTSRYSPWAATTISKGYITAPGGHRVGICGECTVSKDTMHGIRIPTSVCIRVARDFQNIASKALRYDGSVLIIGAPGVGKTTLLRDYIRQLSDVRGEFVSVVDEREEIFPTANGQACFYPGKHTDVLSGCSKPKGIEILLRNMTPHTIAVDEITAEEDCEALLHAGWCGVKLLATAHAGCKQDLLNRPIYKPLIDSGVFDTLLIMNFDKTWTGERLCK